MGNQPCHQKVIVNSANDEEPLTFTHIQDGQDKGNGNLYFIGYKL